MPHPPAEHSPTYYKFQPFWCFDGIALLLLGVMMTVSGIHHMRRTGIIFPILQYAGKTACNLVETWAVKQHGQCIWQAVLFLASIYKYLQYVGPPLTKRIFGNKYAKRAWRQYHIYFKKTNSITTWHVGLTETKLWNKIRTCGALSRVPHDLFNM